MAHSHCLLLSWGRCCRAGQALTLSTMQGWHIVSVAARRGVARLRVTYGRPSRPHAGAGQDSWLARSPLARRFMGHRYQQVTSPHPVVLWAPFCCALGLPASVSDLRCLT